MSASSLPEQRGFYNDLLGLPPTDSSQQEVGVRVGETELVFRAAPPGSTPSYHFAFRIPGNQFSEAKSWLRERTNLISDQGQDEFPWDFWHASAVYTRDPAGNVVELIGFRNLDDSDQPFTSASWLGLAELGLPVHDVGAAVDLLRQTFAIGLWDRQAPAPDRITPVGERGASFIVVTVGRRWFLGDTSADYPLEIVLANVREGELQLAGQTVRIHGCS